jgi:hypothetical protein
VRELPTERGSRSAALLSPTSERDRR